MKRLRDPMSYPHLCSKLVSPELTDLLRVVYVREEEVLSEWREAAIIPLAKRAIDSSESHWGISLICVASNRKSSTERVSVRA